MRLKMTNEEILKKWVPFKDDLDNNNNNIGVLSMSNNQKKLLNENKINNLSPDISTFTKMIRMTYPSSISGELSTQFKMENSDIESAESICRMANGLVKEGIVKGKYDLSKSRNIYYINHKFTNEDEC